MEAIGTGTGQLEGEVEMMGSRNTGGIYANSSMETALESLGENADEWVYAKQPVQGPGNMFLKALIRWDASEEAATLLADDGDVVSHELPYIGT